MAEIYSFILNLSFKEEFLLFSIKEITKSRDFFIDKLIDNEIKILVIGDFNEKLKELISCEDVGFEIVYFNEKCENLEEDFLKRFNHAIVLPDLKFKKSIEEMKSLSFGTRKREALLNKLRVNIKNKVINLNDVLNFSEKYLSSFIGKVSVLKEEDLIKILYTKKRYEISNDFFAEQSIFKIEKKNED